MWPVWVKVSPTDQNCPIRGFPNQKPGLAWLAILQNHQGERSATAILVLVWSSGTPLDVICSQFEENRRKHDIVDKLSARVKLSCWTTLSVHRWLYSLALPWEVDERVLFFIQIRSRLLCLTHGRDTEWRDQSLEPDTGIKTTIHSDGDGFDINDIHGTIVTTSTDICENYSLEILLV